jgi:pyruvate formate lyase activating enzyme
MLIGGLQKTTLVDYPGKVAATVFTLGCSFRCHFCHNPELVLPEQFNPVIPTETVMDFFKSRIGKLEAVCITGGEPTVQKDIGKFIADLKALGYLVKLDTNGTMPDVLQKLIDAKNIDYIAMDIKGPIERYAEITSSKGFEEKIQQSIKMIMASGIPYEFRTTIAKPLHSINDFKGIGQLINGSNLYYIQNFVSSKQVDDKMTLQPFSQSELELGLSFIKKYVNKAYIR